VYNISQFYFIYGFLTGTTQNFARKTQIPIDEIFFNFSIISDPDPEAPEDGLIINGMYLEGAKWDF